MLIIPGTIKSDVVTQHVAKSGNIRHTQVILLEFGDECKAMDFVLPDDRPMAPGKYDVDLTSMIDVTDSYGLRGFSFKNFSRPILKPAVKKDFLGKVA